MTLPFLCTSCRSWLAVLLVFTHSSCAAATILDYRQVRRKNGGGDDSDSDSDIDSESCSNGVCIVCRQGLCTTSTSASNPTTSQTATGTGTGTSASDTAPTGGSVTAGGSGLSNNKVAKTGFSKGGISGLVLGLLFIVGLVVIIFLLKRRAHLRHVRQEPRGMALLSPDTPSNTTSLCSGESGSVMVESGFSPGVVRSAASAIAAANLAAIPIGGYPAPQAYKPRNTDDNGNSTFPTSGILPLAQSKASHSSRQDAPLFETEMHTPGALLLSPLPLVPSPHESFGPINATAASSSGTSNRQSQALPNFLPSTTDVELVACRKELERDNEGNDQPRGSRTVEDPPPVYSD